MKQLIKKSLVTVLFALPAVAAFAASSVPETNSTTMSYVAVIGFFVALLAAPLLPFGQVDRKSLLS